MATIQRVVAFQQRLGGREAHLLDVLVDRRILLDVGVGGGQIGFRLVVVVVGNEVLDRVVREELAHLPVELRRQGLVRREDDGRPLYRLDHSRDAVGLAASGHPQQGLVGKAVVQTFGEFADRLRLVARRLEIGNYLGRVVHAWKGAGSKCERPSILSESFRSDRVAHVHRAFHTRAQHQALGHCLGHRPGRGAARARTRHHRPRTGRTGFRHPGTHQGRGPKGDRRGRHQIHGGRRHSRPARSHLPQARTRQRARVRAEPDHGLERREALPDQPDPGARRSGGRGHRARSVLGLLSRHGQAGAGRAGRRQDRHRLRFQDDPGATGGGDHPEDPAADAEQPFEPDRRVLLAHGLGRTRRGAAAPPPGSDRERRHLRAHPLGTRSPSPTS